MGVAERSAQRSNCFLDLGPQPSSNVEVHQCKGVLSLLHPCASVDMREPNQSWSLLGSRRLLSVPTWQP